MKEELMSRKDDLEAGVRESYALIREYEEIQRLSGDPREKLRAQRTAEEQWGLIGGALEE